MTLTYLPLPTLLSGNFRHLNARHFASYKKIANSIVDNGLLNPIAITKKPRRTSQTKSKQKWNVIDGRKRLIALNILKIGNNLPRSLVSIPCQEYNDEANITQSARPELVSGYELTHHIRRNFTKGYSVSVLAQRYHCSENLINAALSLNGLNPELDQHFRNGVLSFEQVVAFATMPSKDAQKRLLMELGPFVNNSDIIEVITAGATVVNLPSGEALVLPSRGQFKKNIADDTMDLKIAA